MLPFQTLLWSSVTRSCFGTDGLLVKILSAEPAMPDSLGTREVIGNPRQTCPIFTGRWRLLGPNPRPRPRYNVLLRLHHRSGANLIRMLAGLRSLPLQARLHKVEETSPAPVQAPQVLVPEPQAAQPDTTQPMAGAGGDAPVPPSPAPVEGPTLEPAQASNLDSSSIQAAQSKAPEEAPPGTTAGTVETAQAEESSPAAKVPTRRPHLPRQSPLRSCLLNFLTPQLLLYLTLRRLLPRRSQQQGRRRPLLTLPPGAFCPPALMTQIRWNQ